MVVRGTFDAKPGTASRLARQHLARCTDLHVRGRREVYRVVE